MGVSEDVRRRAALHAALGEPVRLAIADRLAFGDASPGELGAALDVPTNLLAHHVRVLEEAGVIRRGRSEGDRRRSYLRLALDDPRVARLTAPLPTPRRAAADQTGSSAERVVFVCTRNSARSQLATAAWARVSPVPTASAGTHPAPRVHPRAVRIAHRHGLHLDAAGTARLDEVVRTGDLVVAVCDNAHEELAGPSSRLHWSIPDPAPLDTDEAFEAAYQLITERVDRLAHAVHTDALPA
ncbi:arsenate reductase/protein-tyrosine-phosphatase family protein [Cryptosporangium minutisporangium]|uniref:Helix-turn-helix domain-containing protein n=1 Tax=Cryptosporangium minutisporangium TaxID=113569 RepID=A0ABP6SPK0_9ACTN